MLHSNVCQSMTKWYILMWYPPIFLTWKSFLVRTGNESILELNFLVLDMHRGPTSGRHHLLPVHYLSIGNRYLNFQQWLWNESLLESYRILLRGIFCNFCHICENKNSNQTPSKSGIRMSASGFLAITSRTISIHIWFLEHIKRGISKN